MTRPARFAAAAFALLAVVGTRPADPASAQPPQPGVRAHHDPGHHLGRVEYLAFRKNDTELVSVGFDGSVRVWDVGPDAAPARTKTAFYFPDTPSSAAQLNRNGEQFLACGFYRREGDASAVVRVVDLNAVPANGPVPHREYPVPGVSGSVTAVAFDQTGQVLTITGAPGELWQWEEKNWAAAKAADGPTRPPVKLVVPNFAEFNQTALTYHPGGAFLAVGGELVERVVDGKVVPPTDPARLRVWAVGSKAPKGWNSFQLPGEKPSVKALAWHAEHGLAVGYDALSPAGFRRAMVAVFPPDPMDGIKAVPAAVELSVGWTNQVAWADDGMLVAALGQDMWNTLPPEFLRVEKGNAPNAPSRLVRLDRDKVFPGMDADPVRRRAQGGLGALAAGRGVNPLALAWADYLQGTIEVARVAPAGKAGTLVSLDPRPREDWVAKLDWEPKKGELVLESLHGRKLNRWDENLWLLAKLPGDGKEDTRGWFYNKEVASADIRPLRCETELPDTRLIRSDQFRVEVQDANGKRPPDILPLPGVRSILAFQTSNAVVMLEGNGSIGFWEYHPKNAGRGPAVLSRRATATLRNGELAFVSSIGRGAVGGIDPAERIVFQNAGPRDVVARTVLPPGAAVIVPPWVEAGLDSGVTTPAGNHTILVRAPGKGKLQVSITDAKNNARFVPAPAADPTGLVTLPAVALETGDTEVTFTLQPPAGIGGLGASRTYPVEVKPFGRVVLIDITPQDGDNCTEWPVPKDKAPRARPYHPTADKLEALLRLLGRDNVVRYPAGVTAKGTVNACQVEADIESWCAGKEKKIGPDDTCVVLLKGHGETTEGPDGKARFMFRTDCFKDDAFKRGDYTGLTSARLDAVLEQLADVTSRVVVVLDCCNAEGMIDTFHRRGVSFYPCSLRGRLAEKPILPGALDRLITRVKNKTLPAGPSGLVTQAELLRELQRECVAAAEDYARNRVPPLPEPPSWGYGVHQGRFVLGLAPR